MATLNLTKIELANAMVELARQKPFHKIMVSDLSQYSGINRRTFYYHFIDKYDLLKWLFLQQCESEKPATNFWGFYTCLANCLNEHREFYKSVYISKDKVHFKSILNEYLHENLLRYVPIEHLEPDLREVYDQCIEFLCITFQASLQEWIVNWPKLSAEHFIAISQFDKIL